VPGGAAAAVRHAFDFLPEAGQFVEQVVEVDGQLVGLELGRHHHLVQPGALAAFDAVGNPGAILAQDVDLEASIDVELHRLSLLITNGKSGKHSAGFGDVVCRNL
jgi:predicted urease superfamily metal-dependent hydrolase